MATTVLRERFGRRVATKHSIPAGETGPAIEIVEEIALITVTAIPGSGGTMTVQYTTSLPSAVAAGTATWQNWPLGTVAATVSDSAYSSITAVRASAATAAGVLEVVQ